MVSFIFATNIFLCKENTSLKPTALVIMGDAHVETLPLQILLY